MVSKNYSLFPLLSSRHSSAKAAAAGVPVCLRCESIKTIKWDVHINSGTQKRELFTVMGMLQNRPLQLSNKCWV